MPKSVRQILSNVYDEALAEEGKCRDKAVDTALGELRGFFRSHYLPPSRAGKDYLDGYFEALDNLVKEIK